MQPFMFVCTVALMFTVLRFTFSYLPIAPAISAAAGWTVRVRTGSDCGHDADAPHGPRHAVALGSDPATIAGLAGPGDLVATRTSSQSRNHWVGIELGQGRRIDAIIAGMFMETEGVKSTPTVMALAGRHRAKMPSGPRCSRSIRLRPSHARLSRACCDWPLVRSRSSARSVARLQ